MRERRPSKKRPTRRRRRPTMRDWKRWERDSFRTRYDLEVFYRGYDRETDNAIEEAAKVPRESSCMMMATGLRDLRFEFKTERSALAAARRIKKAVRGTRFMLRSAKELR